jgi:hypothetical protein
MARHDTRALFEDFLQGARAYARRPGVVAGLQPGEKAVRLRQVVRVECKDPALGRCLEDAARAARHGDTAQLAQLLSEIDRRAADHGPARREPG